MNTFKGMSHGLIFFNTIAGEASTGIGAMMKLCFGSDEDAIAQIMYKKVNGSKTHTWVLPERTGADGTYPIFTGAAATELELLVGRTSQQFISFYTKEMGLRAGRAWRVTQKGIEEIVPATTTPATPSK